MKALVVGGSGYTGRELLRILARHRRIKSMEATSRRYEGKKASEVHPNLEGVCDIKFTNPNMTNVDADVAFLAVPHTEAMNYAPELLERGIRVVDLSADYRLKDLKVYETQYKVKHTSPQYVKDAVYGLPEYHREKVKNARLVANPGCYPTAVILACKPLVDEHKNMNLIVDAKSGVSGAGVKKEGEHQKFIKDENFKAYKIIGHQHIPEMEQELGVKVTFTPHLLPIKQGIFTTVYSTTEADPAELRKTYERKYGKEPFVKVVEDPDLLSVRNTNMCHIGGFKTDGKTLKITCAIDNLIKGASGQAVQNMNLMMGFKETEGLELKQSC